MIKFLFITVNYFNDSDTLELINDLSYLDLTSIALDIVVVDNSNSLDLENNLNFYPIKVNYINSKSNLGYFGSLVLVQNIYNFSLYDYIIISNNDIRILDTKFFTKIFETKCKCEIIAPNTLNNSSIPQNPFMLQDLSFQKKIFWKVYFNNYFFAQLLVSSSKFFKSKKNIKVNDIEKNIASPHGAFVIFTRSFFYKKFDAKYFMYGEENYLSLIRKKKSIKILFNPKIELFHKEGSATGKGLNYSKYQLQKNAYLYFKDEIYSFGLFK